MRECQCSNNEMLGDYFCSDIKRNMDELCRDDEDEIAGGSTTEASDDLQDSATTESEEIDDRENEINVDQILPKNSGMKITTTLNFPVIFSFIILFGSFCRL